jgi:hypothetical protein
LHTGAGQVLFPSGSQACRDRVLRLLLDLHAKVGRPPACARLRPAASSPQRAIASLLLRAGRSLATQSPHRPVPSLS